MQQVGNLLSTTKLQNSNDKRSYAEKSCDWKNAEIGDLNKTDGIDCPICKNKGFVYTHEPDNPVLTQLKCECWNKRNSVIYAKKSGLAELLNHRVSAFRATEQWQINLKDFATEYVKGGHCEWFCILGQSGAGKTHLCSAISKTFIDRGIETKYVVWNTFIRDVKSNMLEDKTMMRKYQIVPVLYIDDLLKGRYTDTDITLLFDLINYRYNNNLTTIITSELSFAKLMEIDSAVAGRIKEKSKKFLIEIEKDDSKNFRLR